MLGDDLLADRFPHTRLMNGKRDPHGSTDSGIAVQVDVASMTLDVVARDTESQAGAFAALGGEERLEDMRQYVFGDAGSRVTHSQLDCVSETHLLGEDRDRASGGGCRGGVEEEVYQDLRELVGVGGNDGQVRRHAVLQLQPAEKRLVFDKAEGVADELRQVHLSESERARASVVHEAVDRGRDASGAFDALFDLRATFARGVFPVQLKVRE